MKHIGLATLGKSAEVKNTASGEPYCNLSLAVQYREKNERKTQWVSATLWGKQAEALAEYLVKGSTHCFTLSDMYVREYKSDNGSGVALQARVDSVELGPKQSAAPKSSGGASNTDDDSDIPF